jgi:hypothetical protein
MFEKNVVAKNQTPPPSQVGTGAEASIAKT